MPSPPARRSLLLALLASAALVMVLGQLDPNAPWPTGGHDNQRTGRTTERGPVGSLRSPQTMELKVVWPVDPRGLTRGENLPLISHKQAVFSSPAVSSSKLLIFASYNGNITAMGGLNSRVPSVNWSTPTNLTLTVTPALSAAHVFVIGNPLQGASLLLCLNVSDGGVLGNVTYPGLLPFPPILYEGMVYTSVATHLLAWPETIVCNSSGNKTATLKESTSAGYRMEQPLAQGGNYLFWVEVTTSASPGPGTPALLRIYRISDGFSCTSQPTSGPIDLFGPSLEQDTIVVSTGGTGLPGALGVYFLNASAALLDQNMCPPGARWTLVNQPNGFSIWSPTVLNSSTAFSSVCNFGECSVYRWERGDLTLSSFPSAPQLGSWDYRLLPGEKTAVNSQLTVSTRSLSLDVRSRTAPVVYSFNTALYRGAAAPCAMCPSDGMANSCECSGGIYNSYNETLAVLDIYGNRVALVAPPPLYEYAQTLMPISTTTSGTRDLEDGALIFSSVTLFDGCAYVGSLKGAVYGFCDPQTFSATATNSPSASPSPTASANRTVSSSTSVSPSPTANATRSVTACVTQTLSASVSPSTSPSSNFTRTPSASSTAASSGSVTSSGSVSGNATVSRSASGSPSLSPSPGTSLSATQWATPSAVWPSKGTSTYTTSASQCPSSSPSSCSTRSPSSSLTGSHSASESSLFSPSITPTASGSPSFSGSPSLSHSTTPSSSVSLSHTPSSRPSASASASLSHTPSFCPSTSTSPHPTPSMPTLTPDVPCLLFTCVPVCDFRYGNPGTLTSSASPHASPSPSASAQPSPSAPPSASGSASPSSSGNGSNSTTASASPPEPPSPAPSPAYAAGATSFAGGERLSQGGVLLSVLGCVGAALAAGALWAWHRRHQAAQHRARQLARATRAACPAAAAAEERAGAAWSEQSSPLVQRRRRLHGGGAEPPAPPAPQQPPAPLTPPPAPLQPPSASPPASFTWHWLRHWTPLGGRPRALQHSVARCEVEVGGGVEGGAAADASAGAALQRNPLWVGHTQVAVGGGNAVGELRSQRRPGSRSMPPLGERKL